MYFFLSLKNKNSLWQNGIWSFFLHCEMKMCDFPKWKITDLWYFKERLNIYELASSQLKPKMFLVLACSKKYLTIYIHGKQKKSCPRIKSCPFGNMEEQICFFHRLENKADQWNMKTSNSSNQIGQIVFRPERDLRVEILFFTCRLDSLSRDMCFWKNRKEDQNAR